MESLVHYSHPSHALSVLGVLNEQRLRGQLCDTVLVVGDQRYQAHRSVLAASSEYFQSLFTRRDSEPQKAVQLDFCEADAFEIVLNYIYSSSLFVDKGSLAAIQELGYSLGIPFLTNIMSTAPHVSYCVSRKRLAFSEEDENDSQQKSVIVCQTQGDPPVPSSASTFRGRHQHTPPVSSETASSPHSFREQGQHPSGPLNESARHSASVPREPAHVMSDTDRKPIGSYASILKGHTSSSARPQLTSSVSFSEVQIQHVRLQVDGSLGPKEEETESHYSPRPPSQSKTSEPSQTIDRSGPLIKSLLRRSLSMDSPVPVFSPTLELKELQNREQSVVKTVAKKEKQPPSEPKPNPTSHQTKSISPLVLRSRYHNRYEEDDPQGDEVRVKTEPSSPLADPSDIIRITVGDSLPVNIKDFELNFDTDPRPPFNVTGKRKGMTDNRRYPFKKSREINEHHLTLDDNTSEPVQHGSNLEDKDEDSEQHKQSKIFKCWSCLKVFRSSAGLHRHVNMYHNPEKPYACDICHKRFHTNFKVWTHCQTQHGVVQNPASSSSSSLLDEKFQKKLIDIVREREIKKALLTKLRRNKQGLPPQLFAKKRTRAHLCPYCGKTFLFQSHFKQHLKTHPTARADQETENEEAAFQKQDQTVHQKENTSTEVYSCRLCNEKLSSIFEQGDHERGCRHATVCPYCGLRFSSPEVKKDHEAHCKYKKLTCLECMRTFKSSFSIWRHQVEVHNHNMMTVREQMSLSCDENNGEVPDHLRELPNTQESMGTSGSREDMAYSDSSGAPMFDSEDSSSYMPEDLSVGQHHGELTVKEEPMEEAVSERENVTPVTVNPEEPGVWPCEKCGKLFGSHKDLERHQELLCHIKPFICHICHKAFRTNFRLWSHFQSHMSASDEPGARVADRRPSSPSPSPPLTPQVTAPPALLSSPPITTQAVPVAEEEEPGCSSMTQTKRPDMDRQDSGHSPLSRTDSIENPVAPQESDTLFYHAPSLSALTFKRQFMCKLCHRTFKTAFSLWSHEQSHSHL
ncbi:zinc finger and BTB domain-containing protein 21 [Osmerus mordax]|uniref:zinc finger and BTB domain-containing protein 21 n=1 Tax=Osmerus mordax TaxID=8014 RepID=UPI00350F6144